MKPTPARLCKVFRYDPYTGHLWWRERGLGRRFSKPAGSRVPKGYIHIEFEGVVYKAHHVVWAIVTGKWPKELDHRNGDEGDNRFDNLRHATKSQQAANKGCYVNNQIGLKGVYLNGNRWRAILQCQKQRKHLGYFETPELAHAAYVKAAKQHFGEFARAR
jgi:hypothetical protein